MSEQDLHTAIVVGLFVVAAAVAVLLLSVVAPYGRHSRKGWGPSVSPRIAWLVMESPAVLAFVAFYVRGPNAGGLVPLVLCGIWLSHYLHRTLVYPFRIRVSSAQSTPWTVVAMAIAFNLANAYVNATWVSGLGRYEVTWLWDPRFIAGVALFMVGYGINRWADAVLRRLRRPGQKGYQIPRGGLYELISCPNYFGEMLEWLGWAIATWSVAGLAFAVFTAANLAPRAIAHHRWYRETFSDYPQARRALVPYLL